MDDAYLTKEIKVVNSLTYSINGRKIHESEGFGVRPSKRQEIKFIQVY